MSLRIPYTLWSTFYDLAIERITIPLRQHSLALLDQPQNKHILIDGIGTGLDLPWLPANNCYVGIDLTPAMLRKARSRATNLDLDIQLLEGDVQALTFPNASFDIVIMHLILAVVPHSLNALREAERVVRQSGRILILDKFLKPGQRAPLRRAISPLLGRLATHTDVVFEDLLIETDSLRRLVDQPTLTSGWFRHILLEKV